MELIQAAGLNKKDSIFNFKTNNEILNKTFNLTIKSPMNHMLSYTYKVHATKWSFLYSKSSKFLPIQPSCTFAHLAANLHPGFGLIGLGTSPSNIILDLVSSISGSGIGIADKSA